MSIYTEIILDHYQNPRNHGKMKNPTAKVKVSNPLCGDKIEMMIKTKGEKIIDMKFQGIGCAISKASSSMLTKYARGKSKEQLKKLDKDFIIRLLGIDLSVNRIKCALLPLEAMNKLLIKTNHE